MEKVIVHLELRPRRGDCVRAAKALGCSHTAVWREVMQGGILGRARRSRLVVKTVKDKGRMVTLRPLCATSSAK